MKNLIRKAQIALLSFGATLLAPVAQAQSTNLGDEVLTESKNALVELMDSLVSLMQVVMGLGAIVVLAIVIFQVFKGEREAAQKLAWWVVGLTLGFTLLTVVSNLVQ